MDVHPLKMILISIDPYPYNEDILECSGTYPLVI
jgi:hypothetical protein